MTPGMFVDDTFEYEVINNQTLKKFLNNVETVYRITFDKTFKFKNKIESIPNNIDSIKFHCDYNYSFDTIEHLRYVSLYAKFNKKIDLFRYF